MKYLYAMDYFAQRLHAAHVGHADRMGNQEK